MNGDNLSDGLCGDGERVVCLAESLHDGQVGIDFQKALVVDDKQGIDILGYLLDTVESLVDFLASLKLEGDGDDADGEDAEGFGFACYDRRGSGAGAASHAGCDESHARAVGEHVADGLDGLFSRFAGTGRDVAGTETFCAELKFHWDGRIVESLRIGVAEHESDIVDAFAVHVIDCVAAAAANADDFDDALFFLWCAEDFDIWFCVMHDGVLFWWGLNFGWGLLFLFKEFLGEGLEFLRELVA